jgi:PST family polysaccharide transporter
VALGLYRIAFNMSSWPVRTVSEAARRVSFAGFSRAATSDTDLAAGFTKGLSPLLTAAVPACALLAALPGALVQAVYGHQWTLAAEALRYLAVLGLLRIVFELCYDYLVAAGKRRTLLIVQGWWLAALIPALIVGARVDGIAGVGIGHCLVAGVLVAPAFVVALRSTGVSTVELLRTCARPALGGALVIGVAVAVHQLAGNSDLALCAASLLAFAAYVPAVVPISRLAHVLRSRRLAEAAL